ncbi:PAS domain-containing protein [Carboxylicivirga taeanensis]|uniref:PAS domain-containing protein n=1 Tax=Carboxylicivirga taeanensis TaxID=1416875 RepID=UPI003F6DC020
MSEFTNTKSKRLEKLMELAMLLQETGNAHSFIEQNKAFIPTVIPSDFIALFDEVMQKDYAIKDVKVLTNKLLNIFHTTISEYNRIAPNRQSFLGILEQNNLEMQALLDSIRPIFKRFGKQPGDKKLRQELLLLFRKLEVFIQHYTIKENVMFPILESAWPDYRCLQIMWSFHDDIRRNIKAVIEALSNPNIELKLFNRCVGDIFFNMLAIKFREERILFPHILSTIEKDQLQAMNHEAAKLGYPYFKPELETASSVTSHLKGKQINLGTGLVDAEQIQLIFNHLPVDITFVDEHNKVCYFSSPKKRIFPRTTAIIGREVNNCHPPESVHVVEQIVEAFRKGEKEQADFWIRLKGEYVLIQYFALRNQQGEYKGVIEVSQEIGGIKALQGERRLLDW